MLFTGSHNITLLWGTIAIAALVAVAFFAVPTLRSVPRRRVFYVLGLGALGVAVNAWFLLPDIVYTGKTAVSGSTNGLIAASDLFSTPGNVFSPLRHAPAGSTTPDLDAQLPVLIGLWAIAVAVLSIRPGFDQRLRRIAAGLAVAIVVFVALLILRFPWDHFPHTLTLIQFTYRLESYIVLMLALLVVVMLRAIAVWDERSPDVARWLKASLAVVLVIGFGQAMAQAWGTGSFNVLARDDAVVSVHNLPKSWFPAGDFRDRSATVAAGKLGTLSFDPATVTDNRVAVHAPSGNTVATNIAGGSYLVKVSGAKSVGRTADGFRVITPDGSSPKVVVTGANPLPVVLGRWITFVALGIAAGLALFCAYTTLVARRRSAGPRR
jgi:hypothetical protein